MGLELRRKESWATATGETGHGGQSKRAWKPAQKVAKTRAGGASGTGREMDGDEAGQKAKLSWVAGEQGLRPIWAAFLYLCMDQPNKQPEYTARDT